MGEHVYLCLNGEFRKASEPWLFPNNRAFRYADVLYENIHAYATEPQFTNYHLERLFGSMHLVSMEIPSYFSADILKQLITQLLNKNRIFGGAHIRLSVFRESDDGFIPDRGRISFILESQKLEHDHYELNDKGLVVDICTGFSKPIGPLSFVRNAHALLYLLAGIESRKKNLDGYILLNETGRIVETVDSNIFLVSGNSIFTPGTKQGCVPGVMRKVVVELAGEAGYRINDQSNLTPAALDDAEEIFLTNAIFGIQWIGAYRQRRYYKKTAKTLTNMLNVRAFGNQ